VILFSQAINACEKIFTKAFQIFVLYYVYGEIIFSTNIWWKLKGKIFTVNFNKPDLIPVCLLYEY